MAVTPYQIVTPIISALAVYYAWSLWMRQKKTLWEVLLWTLFWGGIAFIALFPNSLQYIKVITGIKDATNAALVSVIGILAFVVFTVIIRLEELQQRHVDLVRAMALKDAGLHEGNGDPHPSA